MGNKLCKNKKTDTVDNPKSPFDRIINRLHLRPNAWKSDSHLNQKQVNRFDDPKNGNISTIQPLSKSNDWSETTLEIHEKEGPIHLRNPKLSLIFDNSDTTPVPPPRKHKRGIREKIEAVAKSSLQAFQSKKPVEEPLFTKKIISYVCPICEHDCMIHNRNHKPENRINNNKVEKQSNTPKLGVKVLNKEAKRRKNLSVISLPNYNELKLTVATFDDIDKKPESTKTSITSLPNESKKLTTAASTGKLESYMTRCRSFGSLLPQQLLDKLRVRNIPTDADSDDSFGGLEDWDLRIIEHYNPKEASLPRPVRKKNDKEVLSGIESLVVKDEDEKPLKKINRGAVDANRKSQEILSNDSSTLLPERKIETNLPAVNANELSTEPGEHSALMRILEEYSIKDKQKNRQQQEISDDSKVGSNFSSLTPSLVEFEKNITTNQNEEFINAEKLNCANDRHLTNFGNKELINT